MAVQNADAQALIMNFSSTAVVLHQSVDIDLNGGPGAGYEVTLFIKYPGRADFTNVWTGTTASNGDLDYYDFDFNETGAYELKWALPPDFTEESNVVTVNAYTLENFPPMHDPVWQIPTYAFILASPDPVGVGQYVHVIMWLDKPKVGAAIGNDIRFHDFKLTITKPDGKTETQTWSIIQDPTSSQGYNYAPDQAGTYTFKFDFPQQTETSLNANYGDIYLASEASTHITVQEEPIPYPAVYPLPTEYWTRPIYGENPNWFVVSSNYLGDGSPQNLLGRGGTKVFLDGVGPMTNHVMWTKSIQTGGVVGGDLFEIQGDTYFEGSAYIQRFQNPIIMYGRLFYHEPLGFSSASGGATKCVDIRTGEVIWSRTDLPTFSFGYIYATHQPNQHGVMQPILCTSNFGNCYDADTGDYLFSFENVPSGAKAFGPQGEYLIYTFENKGNRTNPDYYLAEWNSTIPFFGGGLTPSQSGTYDASVSRTNDWEVSVPWRNTMTSSPTVIAGWYNDIMLCYEGHLPSLALGGFGGNYWDPYTYFAVNLNESKGAVGSVLWRKTLNPPLGNISVVQGGVDPVGRVFLEAYKETMQWVAYSMDSGQKLWGPTASQAALDYYGIPGTEDRAMQMAYGKCYSSEFSGIMYCYDEMTGELLWTYGNGGEGNSTKSGFEVGQGNYPMTIQAIANGVIYTVTTEHTIQTPIYKGALARAINATDGTEIWTLSDYTGEFSDMSYAIADGYSTFFNGYDDRIYSVGRGPSATTVTAGPEVSVHGSSVLLKGTVIDTAAGTKQDEQAARFPDGVPAVSDASMKDWMEYVYQQKPKPTDVTGVEVVINVLDPNNNFYEVGRATSDANGMYSVAFTPEVPGKYTIIASFEGSEGYWPSEAETAINVEEAPVATPAPTPTPAPMTDTYIIGFGTAMLIAIIIGFVLLLLRKR
jgi:hypothetical protein